MILAQAHLSGLEIQAHDLIGALVNHFVPQQSLRQLIQANSHHFRDILSPAYHMCQRRLID